MRSKGSAALHGQNKAMPWAALLVFWAIATGTTTGIAVVMTAAAWDLRSPVWFLLAPVAMWAPALARVIAQSTVDREFTATLPLAHFSRVGRQAAIVALAIPLAVYGVAYGIAWLLDWVYWNPGGGLWTSNSRIALNVLVNAVILGTYGTAVALGEELGWRGYLQPRLDSAGVSHGFVFVGVCWFTYHLPFALLDWNGNCVVLGLGLAKGLVLDVTLAYMWSRLSSNFASLWPAVFLHSFHNGVSQWLFPKFFTGIRHEEWLGEGGFLPLAGYIVAALVVARGNGNAAPRARQGSLD